MNWYMIRNFQDWVDIGVWLLLQLGLVLVFGCDWSWGWCKYLVVIGGGVDVGLWLCVQQ